MEKKTVQMKPMATEKATEATANGAPKKLSYDELENIAQQLSNQNRELYTKLQAATEDSMLKRLDYLFKVIQYEMSFDSTFVEACRVEIEDMITIPEEVATPVAE